MEQEIEYKYYNLAYFDNQNDLKIIGSRLIELTDDYICVENTSTKEIIKISVDHIYSLDSIINGTLFPAKKRY